MALTLDAPATPHTIPEMMRAAVLFGPRDIRPMIARCPCLAPLRSWLT